MTSTLKHPKLGSRLLTFFKSFRFPQIHYLLLTALIAIFFTAVSNITLWKHLLEIKQASPELSIFFVLSVPLNVFLLMYAIFLIFFSWKYLLKCATCILFLSCAAATYATWHYGIIFDNAMITSIVETNLAEATSYLSVSSILTVIILGIIPSLLLLRVKIYYPKLWLSLLERVITIIIALALAAVISLYFYQQYTFVGRNNHYLQKEILPVSYLVYTGKYVKNKYLTTPQAPVVLGLDAKKQSTNDKAKLLFGKWSEMNFFSHH